MNAGTVYERLKSKSKRLLQKVSAAMQQSLSHQSIAEQFIRGSGIEVGALHNPVKLPDSVQVKYVDRMTVTELRQQYPELNDKNLVNVDIVANGETLEGIGDGTQDFVIAHQFLEHCQDPIRAIANMLRVLKPKGILYLSVPDKRYSFDAHRPVTDIEHLLRDYHDGPAWSKRQHFEEWAAFVNLGHKNHQEAQADPRVTPEVERLMAMDYSIHYHVWTQTEVLELVLTLQKKLQFPFEVLLFMEQQGEITFILQNQSI